MRKDIIMKWCCRIDSKSKKSQASKKERPVHRFYQPKQWEKKFLKTQSGSQIVAAQLAESQEGCLQPFIQNHQRDVYHRQNGEIAHLLQKSDSRAAHSNFSLETSKVQPLIRVAWLQQNLQHLPKSLGLRTRFSDEGMQVNVHGWDDELVPFECELILLECFDSPEQEMMRLLFKIRGFSQAPLIILTDNYTLDWSIGALRGGADAIFTANMPDDVIVARSNALLRRWV